MSTHTPTEDLVLDVLAARHRLGEAMWTFEARPAIREAVNKLIFKGLVQSKGGVADKTFRAWLTPEGEKEAMVNGYLPPTQRAELARMYYRVRQEPQEGTMTDAIKVHAQACGLVAYVAGVHPDTVARAVKDQRA